MSAPWLSVLIPVYNVEDYLVECLNSIIPQCDKNTEIIILDDQSVDGTYELALQLARSADVDVRVYQQSVNSGISAVRNRLIDYATGEYIWFVDSDDVVDRNAVAQLKSVVDKSSPDLVLCDYCLWRPDSSRGVSKKKSDAHIRSFKGSENQLCTNQLDLFCGLYQQGKLHIWSKIFKKSVWTKDLAFPEGRYFEDMAISPLLALNVHSYVYIPMVWIYYRQRAGSILAVPSMKKIDDMTAGVEGVLSLWSEKYPHMNNKIKFSFIHYCVKIFYFALKELKKLDAYNADRVEEYRVRLYKNTLCSKSELIFFYLQRLQFFRLFKLLRFL